MILDVGLRRSGAGVLNRARARTLKMTIVIVLVFIFCWTPYYIVVLWYVLKFVFWYSIKKVNYKGKSMYLR